MYLSVHVYDSIYSKLALCCVLPGLSKVKMSPSHLAALLGVLGSELQLERRRLFLLGET